MSIKTTEVGKIFVYGTGFDLSGSTDLDLIFTDPNGLQSTISNPRVTAPPTPITTSITDCDGNLSQVTFAASTYMQFTTLATDFTVAGDWTVYGKYTDVTPLELFGDKACFTVTAPGTEECCPC